MLGTLKQTAELVEVFRTRGKELTYKKGEFIIRPGETPTGVFYIYQGLVKAYDITKYGEENLLIIRKEHELFPLIWAITGQERSVIYESLAAKTIVWRIDRDEFTSHMQSHPDALAPLLDMTIEMYRLHSERILNLEYRSVRERIISFLLTMNQRFGTRTTYGSLIAVPLRHQDIASSINSSRETVSRELAALERKGLLSSDQSCITLRDVKALRFQLSE
ncbi:MAG TPA: Crp/Fnr family transcriptional regulator [Candidatus Saccharimonadaceae bacterium]|nr:Crp/Fnr family transcriptional regulator [Candidatus Saccharimonadaceae bacterium]